MLRKIMSLALVASAFAISACNTVQGLGEDVESVGEEGDQAIND